MLRNYRHKIITSAIHTAVLLFICSMDIIFSANMYYDYISTVLIEFVFL